MNSEQFIDIIAGVGGFSLASVTEKEQHAPLQEGFLLQKLHILASYILLVTYSMYHFFL